MCIQEQHEMLKSLKEQLDGLETKFIRHLSYQRATSVADPIAYQETGFRISEQEMPTCQRVLQNSDSFFAGERQVERRSK